MSGSTRQRARLPGHGHQPCNKKKKRRRSRELWKWWKWWKWSKRAWGTSRHQQRHLCGVCDTPVKDGTRWLRVIQCCLQMSQDNPGCLTYTPRENTIPWTLTLTVTLGPNHPGTRHCCQTAVHCTVFNTPTLHKSIPGSSHVCYAL